MVSNKRRSHAAKVLQQVSKNSALEILHHDKSTPEAAIKRQYDIIRRDLMKLREDLVRGFDLTRIYFQKNGPKSLAKDLTKKFYPIR